MGLLLPLLARNEVISRKAVDYWNTRISQRFVFPLWQQIIKTIFHNKSVPRGNKGTDILANIYQHLLCYLGVSYLSIIFYEYVLILNLIEVYFKNIFLHFITSCKMFSYINMTSRLFSRKGNRQRARNVIIYTFRCHAPCSNNSQL